LGASAPVVLLARIFFVDIYPPVKYYSAEIFGDRIVPQLNCEEAPA
jgi:hypothetical protein